MKLSMTLGALAAVLAVAMLSYGQAWHEIGPEPIDGTRYTSLPNATLSGMIDGIVIDPSGSSDSTIYVATVAGGIWKTTDGGDHWAIRKDAMTSLRMGAVALDPSNPSVVYAGLGGAYCCFLGEGGLYRSTDGGDHWKALNPNGLFTGKNINQIVLPASGTLLVGTTSGLYKSVDSGEHFGNNPPRSDNGPRFDNGNAISVATRRGNISNGNISDLKLDTATPTTIYVAIDAQGVYKSIDSGTTFPPSGKLFSEASFPGQVTGSDVYIKFAQSTRPDNKTLYAFLCNGIKATGEPCAMLKSIDGGGRFTRVSLTGTGFSVNQQDYDQIVGVDPQDANKVYIGLRQLYFSADGGNSGFSSGNQIDVNGPHTDEHVIAFSPATHFTGPPTQIYIGSDGGFSSTAALGSAPGSQWQLLNQGLATALLIGIDIGRGGKASNTYSYGALQDNGIIAKTPNQSGTIWQFQCCGDSNSVAVDPLNPLHAIGVDQAGRLQCTTDGQNWANCSGNLPANTVALGLVSFDPSGGTAYATTGSNQLLQSTSNGASFSVLHTFPQPITAISQVKGSPKTIWVGQSDGTMQMTHTALQGSASTWSKVTVSGAPSKQGVNGIAIDPTDTSTVVAVYPGFSGSADPPEHVFLTTDDGSRWKNIGGTANGGYENLPDLPLFAVVILPTTVPHTIIVGSDLGVLQTADLGHSWQVLGTGFPQAQVTGLALDATAKPFVLRASTFGRGAFELEGACPLCPPAPECKKMTGCVSPERWEYSLTCNGLGVGIIYSDFCRTVYGEPTICLAGFDGSTTVHAGWSGMAGYPDFLTPESQGSPTVCTQNKTGEETCRVFTFKNLPACPPWPAGPQPLCGEGQRLCNKFTPPRCVPASECTVIINRVPN